MMTAHSGTPRNIIRRQEARHGTRGLVASSLVLALPRHAARFKARSLIAKPVCRYLTRLFRSLEGSSEPPTLMAIIPRWFPRELTTRLLLASVMTRFRHPAWW